MRTLLNEKGISLIFVVLLILVLGMVSAAMVSMVNTESFNAMNQNFSGQATYLAEAGVEKALYQLKTGTNCAALTPGPTNLGAGSFTNAGTQYNPNPLTTVAAGDVTNVATIIPVVNNAAYAPHGRIQIDSELINYTAKSGATQLIVARRGINGTTAASHLAGASVLQGQCLIRSTGTIPNPLPGISSTQRVIEMSAAISSRQGSFTKSTAGAPVNQSITGVGFQPKAVIFFWTRQTATGFGPLNQDINAGVGFATAATERAISYSARDGRGRSEEGRRYSQTNAIIFLTGGGPPTLAAQANLATMDPDGFTLNWTTNDGNAYLIHYIALGGDITNAFSGTQNLTTATGHQSVTGVGFQPDFVMLLWSHTGAFDSDLLNSEIGIGFAKSATTQGAMVYAAQHDDTDNNAKRWQQRTTDAILLLNPTVDQPTQDAVADFVSMDMDGFTVNVSDPPGNTTSIFFLALKGGRHQVSAFNQPTTTGNQSITGVGFRQEQLMLASFNLMAQTGVVGGGAISYGAAQFPNARGGIWFQDRSDADPSDANMYTNNTNLLTLAQGNDASLNNNGNPTINAQADFVSFDKDGFTLNWTTADATARQILYWAIGPTVMNGKIDWQEVY